MDEIIIQYSLNYQQEDNQVLFQKEIEAIPLIYLHKDQLLNLNLSEVANTKD